MSTRLLLFLEVLSLGYLEIKANNDEMAPQSVLNTCVAIKTCCVIKHSVLQLKLKQIMGKTDYG